LLLTVLVSTSLALSLLRVAGRVRQSRAGYGLAVLLVIPFIFLPNLLFAFTERYRAWVKQEPFYIGSFYSGFAICLALALTLAWLFSTEQGVKCCRALLCLVLLLVTLLVYRNQVQANRFFDESRLQSIRWALARNLGDKLAKEHLDTHTICTQTLIRGEDPYDYWSSYISDRAGRKISLRYSKTLDDDCDSFLTYRNWGDSCYFNLVGTKGNLLERITP
jgi:hypothetical protein